ncbi:DUF397 domain-containing protein [Longispora sp. NPDC051575]|uniref:DUF397 domain-containing protein n=1 Tax=Longispora sp. NPDC051575 TaxID=3154943 RepID=UPI0034479E41
MTHPTFSDWHKSTRSDQSGCVEMSSSDDQLMVGIRDTKDRSAGTLVFGSADWQTFLNEAKGGSFVH